MPEAVTQRGRRLHKIAATVARSSPEKSGHVHYEYFVVAASAGGWSESLRDSRNTPNLGDFVRPKFGRTKHRLTTNFVRSQKDVLRTFEAGFSNAGYSRICA